MRAESVWKLLVLPENRLGKEKRQGGVLLGIAEIDFG
jgi:hypothetical protein